MRNLLKKKMVDRGRDDFVNCLAEVLEISRQTASDKLNGSGRFNESELAKLTIEFDLSGEELKNAIIK